MIKCVCCYNLFTETVSLHTLFIPKIFCDDCLEKFNVVENCCEYCSHPIGHNCCDKSLLNKSVFVENQFLKDMLFQIKSYNLVKKIFVFEKYIFEAAQEFKGYIVVYVPLSEIMKNKRGFNQAKILAQFTGLEVVSCIERVDNITQSKKNYYERIHNPPKFKLKYVPRCKNILIVDDIYTTGTTVKQILKLFPKDYNVRVLTLQRTVLKLQQ